MAKSGECYKLHSAPISRHSHDDVCLSPFSSSPPQSPPPFPHQEFPPCDFDKNPKMRTAAVASLALVALSNAEIFEAREAAPKPCKKYVTSEKLQKHIELDNLLAGSQKLQDIADSSDGHRAFGSVGHNKTVDFLVESLEALDYYDVVKQPFHELYATADGTLTVDGKEVESGPMTYTPSGSAVDTPLIKVNNLGCDAGDYPAEVEGNIAFISRGTCPFGQKASNAKAAGAVGAVIYNNLEGPLSGTLGEADGDYAPVVGISLEDAQPILSALEAGEVTASLEIDAVVEDRVTFNVIAETRGGDHDNVLVLGGHTDSVPAGPGINDDGSGVIGILEVAKALKQFKVKNAVRFAFWSAEEFGLLGSYHYVKSLNSSDAELAKMRAYLNFDMVSELRGCDLAIIVHQLMPEISMDIANRISDCQPQLHARYLRR